MAYLRDHLLWEFMNAGFGIVCLVMNAGFGIVFLLIPSSLLYLRNYISLIIDMESLFPGKSYLQCCLQMANSTEIFAPRNKWQELTTQVTHCVVDC